MPQYITKYGVHEQYESGSSYLICDTREQAEDEAAKLNKEWRARTPLIILVILWFLQSYPKWGVREEVVTEWTDEELAQYGFDD